MCMCACMQNYFSCVRLFGTLANECQIDEWTEIVYTLLTPYAILCFPASFPLYTSGLELAKKVVCALSGRQTSSRSHYSVKATMFTCGISREDSGKLSSLSSAVFPVHSPSVQLFFPNCWPCWQTMAPGSPPDGWQKTIKALATQRHIFL